MKYNGKMKIEKIHTVKTWSTQMSHEAFDNFVLSNEAYFTKYSDSVIVYIDYDAYEFDIVPADNPPKGMIWVPTISGWKAANSKIKAIKQQVLEHGFDD